MKHIIVASLILTLSACNSQHGIPYTRPHIEQDTLGYLVENADSIAIIDITNSIDIRPGIRFRTQHMTPTVTAQVAKVLKGDIATGSDIVVSRLAVFTPPPSTGFILALGNGRHIAFLKASDNQHFAPLTDCAVIEIIAGELSPIWHRERHTDEVRHASRISLEELINEIEDALP